MSIATTSTQSPLLNAIKSGETENGCVTNTTSGNYLVDFFFQVAAMRTRDEAEIINSFSNAFGQDPSSALKILFWVRDVREGQGERRVFRTIIKHLAHNHADVLRPNINLISDYGRWDDVLSLFDTPLEHDALELIAHCLEGSQDALCAKWMPREKSSKRSIATKIRKHMNLSPRQYRKKLASMTSVVESQMCENEWSGIKYSAVPSVAMNTYKKAFQRHAPELWEAYVSNVVAGNEKINASALYPYQIIKSVIKNNPCWGGDGESFTPQEIALLDEQWKALPNWLMSNPHRILPVVDTSGSMYGHYGESVSTVLPIEVSVSLGLYIAERNNGPFKDHFITFSDTPRLQTLEGVGVYENTNALLSADWGMSTNIEAVFNLILTQATKFSISEDDMPDMLLILSDMEFNQCAENYSLTAMESIRRKYSSHGYSLPKIVFWNLSARGSNFPVTFDSAGTALVSGFSPSILKQILMAGDITPISIMNEVVNSERYRQVSAG